MSWWTKFVIGASASLAASGQLWGESAGPPRTGWSWPSYIVVPLVATALLYAFGVMRTRRRRSRIRILPVLCFAAGWLSLLVALDSPIHELSEQLFWVHMTQHEILMLISAPLLVLSQPTAEFIWALPETWRVPVANAGKLRILRRG